MALQSLLSKGPCIFPLHCLLPGIHLSQLFPETTSSRAGSDCLYFTSSMSLSSVQCMQSALNTCCSKPRGFPHSTFPRRPHRPSACLPISLCHKNHRFRYCPGGQSREATFSPTAQPPLPSAAQPWSQGPGEPRALDLEQGQGQHPCTSQSLQNQP